MTVSTHRRVLPEAPARRGWCPGLSRPMPTGDGLLARCLQHETDHTLGTVFGDRVSAKQRKKLQKAHDKAAEDYPAEWPA